MGWEDSLPSPDLARGRSGWTGSAAPVAALWSSRRATPYHGAVVVASPWGSAA